MDIDQEMTGRDELFGALRSTMQQIPSDEGLARWTGHVEALLGQCKRGNPAAFEAELVPYVRAHAGRLSTDHAWEDEEDRRAQWSWELALMEPEALVEVLGELELASWDASSWRALSRALRLHELFLGVTDAHHTACRLAAQAGLAEIRINTPHTEELEAHGFDSYTGRYFATGSSCGDYDMEPGNVAIWEVATGRCVNVLQVERGPVGWMGTPEQLQWSPRGALLGVGFDTNGVGWVDPFGEDRDIIEAEYLTNGRDSPPGWCWAPDGEHIHVSAWSDAEVPGWIITARDEYQAPRSMGSAGGEDLGGIQALRRFGWGERDGRSWVAGLSYANREAYGIDQDSGELLWLRKYLDDGVVSRGGERLAYFKRGSLIVLDGLTGEAISEGDVEDGERLAFSPDATLLAVANKDLRTVRIYEERDGALELAHEIEPASPVSKDTSWRYPEASPLALGPRNTWLALLCEGDEVETWKLGERGAERRARFTAPGYQALYMGDGMVVGFGQFGLIFADADTGEIVAKRDLFETPAKLSLVERHDLDPEVFETFISGEEWGYVIDQSIVVGDAQGRDVHLAVARRHGWPLRWAAHITRATSLSEVARTRPELFTESVRAALLDVEEEEEGFDLREVEDGGAALVDYLFASLRDYFESPSTQDYQREDAANYASALVCHHIARGELQRALELDAAHEDIMGDASNGPWRARVAAYLAHAGEVERATEIAAGIPGSQTHKYDSLRAWGRRASYLAVVEHARGHEAERDELLERVEKALRTAEVRPDYTPGVFASALLMIGQTDRAIERGLRLGTTWWRKVGQFFGRLLGLRDPAVLERYLERVDPDNTEMLDLLPDFYNELGDPARAMKAFEGVERFSSVLPIEQVARHTLAAGGSDALAAMMEPMLEQFYTAQEYYRVADTLWTWASVDPDGIDAQHIERFITRTPPLEQLTPWRAAHVLRGMCIALPRLGRTEELVALFEGAAPKASAPWWALAQTLGQAHPSFEHVAQRAIEECKPADVLRAMHHVSAEVYEMAADQLVERAGRDGTELASLIGHLLALSPPDVERAETCRLKLRGGQRTELDTAFARGTIGAGLHDAAIEVLAHLDHGFGSYGREYEALRALEHDYWRTCPIAE